MELPLCECGCGERVSKPGNRFVWGHQTRGVHNPNYGKRASKERRREMSEARKGIKHSEDTKRNMSEARKGSHHHYYGKKRSIETRRKISKTLKGRAISEEARRNRSGSRHHSYGKHFSVEHKRNISKALKGKYGGEKAANWQGGKSLEPYGADFNDTLRSKIRERDGYTCQLCGAPENGRAHQCHHIDYVKRHNNTENFCLLCDSCHIRTNYNRAFWTHLFQAEAKLEQWRV